ncbi:MAG TPA: family 1 glycosylhydrolase [Spirochaetota bacterium]|nr:family 1 glycosylhydrolase [Spirochaetota bacterium]HPJ43850.1 family 1 glycosylhydrolase [Spirochaetota bacterium]
MKKFPAGFYFGAATSSHQVEGNCDNDWSRWEKKNAERLAAEYVSNKSGLSDPFYEAGSNPENYISGNSVDHYSRFEEDFTHAEKIGLNSYRFSIEWSRIEPADGKWDEKEIEHYIKVIKTLRKKNIEPFITIWHWPLPVWLADDGGIMNPRFADYFSRYASKLAESFGKDVSFYITINEPEIYSLNSYMLGKWTPQKKGVLNYYRAIKVLIRAHNAAYKKIKEKNASASAGPACNMTYFESGGGVINNILVRIAAYLWNMFFISRVKRHSDFIGINYYFHNRIRYGLNKNDNEKVSDMGWELYPAGISYILDKIKKFNLPVYITENGLADENDLHRGWLLTETLKAVYKSIENGIDVRGYFHWSLLDNFEWDKGFWPKFGLISVDRRTMKRTLRGSADVYRNIIKRGLDI